MDVVTAEKNKLSMERISLQHKFNEYNNKNGFSYETWLNPPKDHFYATYKREIQAINEQMAPALS